MSQSPAPRSYTSTPLNGLVGPPDDDSDVRQESFSGSVCDRSRRPLTIVLGEVDTVAAAFASTHHVKAPSLVEYPRREL
jgi:hypothetical protein